MHFLQIVWEPATEGINIGSFTLHYYSIMWMLAFVSGWYIMKKIYKNENQSEKSLDSLFIYSVIGIMIGARLGHVIFYQPELFKEDFFSVFLPFKFNPEFEFTGFRGLASHGATLGMIISMYFYNKKILKKPYLWIADRIIIPIALGACLVRVGNFFNSEMVGHPTESSFGVVFKALGEDFARHPGQLYEAFGYLILFIVVWFTYWKTNKKEKLGYIFGLFFVILWSVRFVVEYFKVAQVDERSDWLFNTGQLLSIPFILVGLYFMFIHKPKTP